MSCCSTRSIAKLVARGAVVARWPFLFFLSNRFPAAFSPRGFDVREEIQKSSFSQNVHFNLRDTRRNPEV